MDLRTLCLIRSRARLTDIICFFFAFLCVVVVVVAEGGEGGGTFLSTLQKKGD